MTRLVVGHTIRLHLAALSQSEVPVSMSEGFMLWVKSYDVAMTASKIMRIPLTSPHRVYTGR